MNHSTTENCPYCMSICFADWVDVGVPECMQQCGPFYCTVCGASEIGPYDEKRALTDEENRTGWYAPGSEPGSSANVIDGRVVTAKEMEQAYRTEYAGNPMWGVEGHVENWREELRRRK